MFEQRDSPYPQLKKTHTMARLGRPWTDHKPPPAAPVWSVIEGLGSYYILLAAIELDIFDVIDRTGPTRVETLSKETDSSTYHLRLLLDAVVALGLLDQFDDIYQLNDTAKRYLLTDGPASMAGLVAVAPGPQTNWACLADTVRSGRVASPIENDRAGFYVPLVEGTFTTMYRCAARSDLKLGYSAMSSPRILDLGAGGAPWAIAVLERNSTATAVVNDLPIVIDVAQRKVVQHGVADRTEFLTGDFHQVDLPADEFDLVILGHVCRTEGADGAIDLIKRAFAATRPGGRLILADYFVDPERKLNPHAVLMAATMMASTTRGAGFTHQQFAGWIRSAGFEALRVIEPIGFQQQIVASKPREGQ